jgi:acyl transferase domain-containing protein
MNPFSSSSSDTFNTDIAVVGMAGRFPGARNVREYWHKLRNGIESIERVSDEQLLAAGVDAAQLADLNYVKATAALPGMAMFDAPFFGFSPREAAVMDPQHRHFLECAWEALEDAGHTPERFGGAIGVFGGSGHNAYMPYNLLNNRKLMQSMGFFLVRHTGNDKDFLTTRVSYLLNLKGPSVNVQTACSTSLVAMHMGVQSLLNRECDMALAGGVTIELPHHQGYVYREGEILSPDGHCHAFDADSQGTVFGSGVGIVALRRLADAIADGDHIHAVIKGSAINNDGAMKVGYLAPSVDGQAQAISEALAIANVSAETISYVEAHGTGTPVGDPIEVAALTQAFRQSTDKVGYCGIGSVKSNIGHTDTAAGVASFIKVALAMQHRELPPTLHFARPNPACDFDTSPFVVNAALRPWTAGDTPRRAGVSSLGVGGTNAHLIVEEAPPREAGSVSRRHQLVMLSAKTSTALDANAAALADQLAAQPDAGLADVAYTLRVGRQPMLQRRFVVATDAAGAAQALQSNDAQRSVTVAAPSTERSVAFMFAGGGAQYPGMGADLYQEEPVFRAVVDECLALLSRITDADYRSLLFPPAESREHAAAVLQRPAMALPALFTIQLAQARLWMSWGVEPAAMIGHSMGEYTAAHLAGVFSLEDALRLVHLRGRLFETLPEGAMLSVSMPAAELRAMLPAELSIAADNGPSLCVAAGPVRAIESLQKTLENREIDSVRVRISVAAHSAMLEPILSEFGAFFSRIVMKPPTRPFVSNLSGTWITHAEATDPQYWVRHLRQTVQFGTGLQQLLTDDSRILLEVGPGRTLATLARTHTGRRASQPVLNSLRHPDEPVHDQAFVLGVLGRLWGEGARIDWDAFASGEKRLRVPLPTYQFDHQRHWIDPMPMAAAAADAVDPATASLDRHNDRADWFYQPVWRAAPAVATRPDPAATLVFADDLGLADTLVEAWRAAGHVCTVVRRGAGFARDAEDAFRVDPTSAADAHALMSALAGDQRLPRRIVHLLSLTGARPVDEAVGSTAFFSLLHLAQALGQADHTDDIDLLIATDHLYSPAGEGGVQPAKALLLGPAKVLPREFPGIRVRCVDLKLPPPGSWQAQRLASTLMSEFAAPLADESVALREGQRWTCAYDALRLPAVEPDAAAQGRLRQGAVVMITGGLGGVGMALAERLAADVQARLVLVGRGALPPHAQWDAYLAQHAPNDATSRRIRQVRALEARGVQVLVLQADVTDKNQMRAAVQAACERFGTVHGVLHTAGVLADGVIQLKDDATAAAVLAPKVQGTLALDAALAGIALDFFVLFSSVSSFSGLAGQVDYAAANAFLDAFARERSARTGGYTVAVNWSAWQEVGMAAEMAQRLGITPQAEATPQGVEVNHPLVERRIVDKTDEREYATRFSTERHWLLAEHRVRGGDALIPGTGYLEIVRAAFTADTMVPATSAIEWRDLTFLVPFVVRAQQERELRVHFRRIDAASQAFVVRSRAGDDGTVWIEHVRGRIAVVDLPQPAALPLPAIAARCRNDQREFRGDEQAVSLDFGPRWSNRRRIAFGPHEALIELALPPAFESDLQQHALHPALMDWATGGAQQLIPGYDEAQDFFVPASYGRVRMFAPLVPRLVAHVRLRDDDAAGDEIASFDVTIADSQGRVLVEVSEFTMIRVRDKALLAAAASGSNESAASASPAVEPHKAQATANPILTLGLRDGIRPDEGADALARILAAGAGPQVVVSPQGLAALVAHLRAPAERSASASPLGAAAAAAAPARDVSALEAALASHEAVREAAAAAHGDRVLAYVAYHPEHSITVSELRRHVRGLVSEDLVPQTVIELDALPRGAGGEIDRAALPNPFAAEEAATVGPRTEMEQTIATLWQDLLGVESVGVHDNFFDIGGHSLLSVRFIMRLDKKIGVRLLHEHVVVNTLEQIAAKCAQMRGDAVPAAVAAAPAAAALPPAAAEPAAQAPAKPRGLLGAVKQAVLGR